ncbi:MAG: hypothetical protein ABL866_14515 [Devosia sp.]
MLKSLLIGAGAALLLSAPVLACTEVSSATVKLTGCIDAQWGQIEGSGAIEFNYLTSDQNFALQLITETAVLPAQALHDAVIANAVSSIGGNADGVKTIAERVESIDGRPFNVLQYEVTDANGLTISYQNFYLSQPGFGTLQILVFSLPPDAAAAGFKAGQFASTIKIGG